VAEPFALRVRVVCRVCVCVCVYEVVYIMK
jgi:hypothetical protein